VLHRKCDQQTRDLQVHGAPESDKITTVLRLACPAHRPLASRPGGQAPPSLLSAPRPRRPSHPVAARPSAADPDKTNGHNTVAPPSRRCCITRFRPHFLELRKSAPTCLTSLVAKPFICRSGSCGAWRKTAVAPFTSIGRDRGAQRPKCLDPSPWPEMNATATARHVDKLAAKAARLFGSTPTRSTAPDDRHGPSGSRRKRKPREQAGTVRGPQAAGTSSPNTDVDPPAPMP
jgi:hypothetical protein